MFFLGCAYLLLPLPGSAYLLLLLLGGGYLLLLLLGGAYLFLLFLGRGYLLLVLLSGSLTPENLASLMAAYFFVKFRKFLVRNSVIYDIIRLYHLS